MATAGSDERRPARARARPLRVIQPRGVGLPERAAELWRFRHALRFFGRRFLEKAYLRTWLGWIWIPIRPIMDVGTKILVFGTLLAAPSNGVPYAIFFLVGQTTWLLFSSGLYWGTRSIELSRRFLRHLYIPRLTLLTSALTPPIVNTLIYAALALIVVAYYALAEGHFYIVLGPETPLALAGVVLVVGLAVSISFFTSVWGAQMRDVRFTLSYILGFLFFLSPVIYPLSAVPSKYQGVASVNPMSAPLELVRRGVLGTGDITAVGLASSIGFLVVVGGLGLRYFHRSESAALDRL